MNAAQHARRTYLETLRPGDVVRIKTYLTGKIDTVKLVKYRPPYAWVETPSLGVRRIDCRRLLEQKL